MKDINKALRMFIVICCIAGISLVTIGGIYCATHKADELARRRGAQVVLLGFLISGIGTSTMAVQRLRKMLIERPSSGK